MSTTRITLKDELIQLAEGVCADRGWTERYLSERFGQSNAMAVLRHGKHGLGLNTAERFRGWLLEQLGQTEQRNVGADPSSATGARR